MPLRVSVPPSMAERLGGEGRTGAAEEAEDAEPEPEPLGPRRSCSEKRTRPCVSRVGCDASEGSGSLDSRGSTTNRQVVKVVRRSRRRSGVMNESASSDPKDKTSRTVNRKSGWSSFRKAALVFLEPVAAEVGPAASAVLAAWAARRRAVS